MKQYLTLLLLAFVSLLSAQTIECTVAVNSDGFDFTRKEIQADGNYDSRTEVGIDTTELLRLISIQMDMAVEAESKVSLQLKGVRRTLRDLRQLHDAYMPVSYKDKLLEFAGKFDGIWRYRSDKEKFEVEIVSGKIRADDVRNGTVAVLSEKSILVKGFNKLEDFELYEVKAGLLAGEVGGEKVVLRFVSKNVLKNEKK